MDGLVVSMKCVDFSFNYFKVTNGGKSYLVVNISSGKHKV